MPTAVENPGGGLVDILLKVTGVKSGWIKGESKIAKHEDEIDLQAYRWGVTQGFDAGTGRPSGKRQHKPLIVTMHASVASPLLYSAACRNEVLKTVVLTCRKAGGVQQDYMVWTLTNASISDIRSGYFDHVPAQTSGQPILPYDEISFVFQKIQLDYKPQGKEGGVGAAVNFTDDWSLAYS